jgi:transcription elongation factor GreA
MSGTIPITREGYEKLIKELELLKKVERPAIIKKVAEARSHGDLSENAEYHAAREKQSHIESRIRYLEDKLARSEITVLDTAQSDTVVFGCTVKIMDLEDESLEEYTLVGAAEADPSRGLISTVSPLGKALIGKQKNDEFSVQTPGGELKMKIIDFS